MTEPIRILYAEDDARDADRVRECLGDRPGAFLLEVVDTAKACLDRVRESPPDVLLLDNRLPDADGIDVVEALAGQEDPFPIVLVTGLGDEALVVRALRSGASSYLTKSGKWLEELPTLLLELAERFRRGLAPGLRAVARRVLYVEHNRMDVELTLRHLAEGAPRMQVEVARDSEEAMKCLSGAAPFDMMLVDLRMPGKSGLEFIGEARSAGLPVPPFVLLTGAGDEAAAIASMRLGAADYLIKGPGYLDGLIPSILRVIVQARLERTAAQLEHELAERKQAEQVLRERNALLDALINSAADIVIFSVDREYRYTAFNARHRQDMRGAWGAEIAEGDSLLGHLTDDLVRDRMRASLDRALAGEAFSEVQHQPAADLDHEFIWSPIRGPGGEVCGVTAFVRDITAKVRIQRALEESERRFRKLFEDHSAVKLLIDPADGTILDANPASARFYGWSCDRLRSMRIGEINASPEAEVSAQMAEARVGRRSHFEFRHRMSDGSVRDVDVFSSTIRLDGRDLLHSIVHDSTAKREAQRDRERLSTAMEQAEESVVITDARGNIEYVNHAFEVTTGYSRAEVIGQNPRKLKSGKQDGAFYRGLWDTIGAGRTWHGRFVNVRKDGREFTEDASISPVRNAVGSITSFVAVKRDVTRDLDLEARLLQSQKMEGIGRLAGGVAHDFNNLLTVILGCAASSLEQVQEGSEVRQDLVEIQAAGQRAAGLTRQLLAFSRRQVLELEVLDLNAVLADVDRMMRRIIGEDVHLVVVPGPELGKVRADRGQVEQVLLNLVVNARDAMPRGGRLTIATSNVPGPALSPGDGMASPASGLVRITVEDTGSGMDEETLAHIFEPFFTTKGPGKGTGLGLSTVYGIVNQSGGRIAVRSSPGRGTTFEIDFPQVLDEELATPSTPPTDATGGGRETVLLVEDDSAVRQVVSRSLEGAGYRVLAASGSEEALRRFAEDPDRVDIVVTDVVMPGESGGALVRRLRELRPRIQVIFVSGYTDDAVGNHGVLGPEVDFLPKPFTGPDLVAKLRQVLERRVPSNS